MTLTDKELDRIVEAVLRRINHAVRAEVEVINNGAPEPEYITPLEAQAMFGLKADTVRLWVRTGKIEGRKGRPCLVKMAALREAIEGTGE